MLLIFILLFLIFHIFRVTLFETYLWQLKEYRIDRIKSHLSTKTGSRLLYNPLNIAKWIILIICIFFRNFDPYYQNILLMAVYTFEIALSIRNGKKSIIFPKWSVKSISVILLVLFFSLVMFLKMNFSFSILILIMDRSLFLLITLAVYIVNIPVEIIKKILNFSASYKINHFKKLKVIGITGSYGKTSTKEFLSEILSGKYKLLKTKGYNNTDISVSLTILKELNQSHKVFVAEMGAYKSGEINTIASMIKPHIGIITGINEQHLSLFGDLERTMHAKFELIKKIRKNGIALFNTTDKRVRITADWARIERPDLMVIEYKVDYRTGNSVVYSNDNSYIAYNPQSFKDGITFELSYQNKKNKFKTGIIGEKNIENILGAIIVSGILNMKRDDIIRSVKNLNPPAKTMRLLKIKGHFLINDTFNSNPSGVFALIDYMKLYKGKRMLIFTPIIELGNDAGIIHEKIGQYASSVCDFVFITNSNYSEYIIKGASIINKQNRIILDSPVEIIKSLKNNLDKNGIMVFSGKESTSFLNIMENFIC
jgi:UDP-N-acetylmuramoyl-tripeptide--D-alanyl-D-alanine ligase